MELQKLCKYFFLLSKKISSLFPFIFLTHVYSFVKLRALYNCLNLKKIDTIAFFEGIGGTKHPGHLFIIAFRRTSKSLYLREISNSPKRSCPTMENIVTESTEV